MAFPAMGWTLPPCWPVWWPLVLFFGMSGMVVGLNLDLVLARCFWSDTSGWSLAHAGWAQWIYRWSNVPALVIGGTGLLVGLVSWRISRLRPWRRPAWFLALALLAGPGLTVNALLKPYYGRPRPRMVREFGGKESFRPLGSPTFDSTERSFPSGHASMAFYWLAPMIIFWRNHRKLAVAFLLLALVHGGTTGFVRMAQGGHWFSDVLWSAGFVYFAALAVHAALPVPRDARTDQTVPSAGRLAEGPQSIDRDRAVRISIVVPFFNEAENVAPILGELLGVLPAAEIIAVDDGSSDATWAQIQSVRGVRGVRLGRNLGQSAAVYYGLHAATGELCGVMDGDGQNDPANFLLLLREWTQGDADVVCGYRENRADVWRRRIASRIANRVRRWFLDDGVRDTGCSQKLFPRAAVEVLVPFRGMHRYLPALFKQAGLRITEVPVLHRARRAGISKYNNWSRARAGIHDLIGVSWLLKRKLPATAPLPKP
jgi:dolichol-phosphate mannosyltransferase